MNRFVVLLRGINVGGKNKLPMADLRAALGDAGYADVSTYIQSGNIALSAETLDGSAISDLHVGFEAAVARDSPGAVVVDEDIGALAGHAKAHPELGVRVVDTLEGVDAVFGDELAHGVSTCQSWN